MASALLLLLGLVLVTETYSSAVDFAHMVGDVTGREPFFSYVFYGCHCGIGGSGRPVDNIDWCCHAHDCCYDKVSKLGCAPLMDSYKYSYKNQEITCDDKDLNGCDRQSCECDRLAALCLKKQDGSYSEDNKFYDKKNKCSQIQPAC